MTNDNTTEQKHVCYHAHANTGVCCHRKSCRHWINYTKGYNCVLATASTTGPLTMQEIGKIYEVSRMKVCQLEKEIFETIRQKIEEAGDR